jgi:hypothetical protein
VGTFGLGRGTSCHQRSACDTVMCLISVAIQEASTNFSSYVRANPPVTHSTTLLTPNLLIQRYGELLLPSKLKQNKGKGVDLSLRDARVLLKYLQRDKRILVGDASGEVCICVMDTPLAAKRWLSAGL